MKWYRDLYVGESIRHKEKKIRWKIRHRAGMVSVYVLSVPEQSGNLLELIPSRELLQRGYPTGRLFIVGIAGNYEEAQEVAGHIISQVYRDTGDVDVHAYFDRKQQSRRSDRGKAAAWGS